MNLVVVFLPLIFSVFLSNFFPMDDKWYASLKTSPHTPPGHVFGLVWTILYVMIGWSLTTQPQSDWLLLNLVINYLWVMVFNHLKDIRGAFWLLMGLCVTMVVYLDKSRNWIMLPYLGWLLFALYLNYELMVDNKDKINTGPLIYI